MSAGWIGVDLDGTLAEYDGWRGIEHIGPPIPAMLERVRGWLAAGQEVRIVTARVSTAEPFEAYTFVRDWCIEHFGHALPVTCRKDYDMIELWDDRAVRVVMNTGERCCG